MNISRRVEQTSNVGTDHRDQISLTTNNKQTNFYLRSDNNMLHMSRYNMHNNISYRGGCAKK